MDSLQSSGIPSALHTLNHHQCTSDKREISSEIYQDSCKPDAKQTDLQHCRGCSQYWYMVEQCHRKGNHGLVSLQAFQLTEELKYLCYVKLFNYIR